MWWWVNMVKNVRIEDAVSPVVGVMLMLVVTIIIAAIVSAFAGGMADSQKVSPSLVVKGSYSQDDGMRIEHAGGDPVALSEIEFRTVPSELFGTDASKFGDVFPKSILTTPAGDHVVNLTTGFYEKSAFVAGDVLVISHADANDYISDTEIDTNECWDKNNATPCINLQGDVNYNAQVWWGNNTEKLEYFRAYQFANPINIGKYFYLDVLDPTGNIITRAKIDITG